ncbi:hypothetical protein BGZ52_006644 [Haplosporangium bisporale]|nr:hypothetical protein BGZ52_006644 [Haplosporangium bisporale]
MHLHLVVTQIKESTNTINDRKMARQFQLGQMLDAQQLNDMLRRYVFEKFLAGLPALWAEVTLNCTEEGCHGGKGDPAYAYVSYAKAFTQEEGTCIYSRILANEPYSEFRPIFTTP